MRLFGPIVHASRSDGISPTNMYTATQPHSHEPQPQPQPQPRATSHEEEEGEEEGQRKQTGTGKGKRKISGNEKGGRTNEGKKVPGSNSILKARGEGE